ncbi:MAG: 2-dehydropantoate 2-reductase [Burkholderiales bacterium]|nr:2-dehydropantoate 2-reductase [Burkholderiales bacterium]
MKICMLGAGALGSAIGGVLTEGGHDVWLVDAWREHVEAMSARGLTMRDGADRTVRVQARTSCEGIGPAELVVVLVKSYHTEEAVRSALASGVVGPSTVVMSMQNGLGHEDVIAGIVGRGRTMAGKTYTGGVVLGPGHVIAGTRGKASVVGELDGRLTERAQRIAAAFTSAGLETSVSDNIAGVMWDKLFVNVATGALAGITRLTYGDLYQVPAVEACALAAVSEAMAVARALGVKIATTKPEEPWRLASAGLPPEFKTSMLQSLEKGLPTEIDFINGSVVRAGERCGVPTPVNATLVACMKGVEVGLRVPGFERHRAGGQ